MKQFALGIAAGIVLVIAFQWVFPGGRWHVLKGPNGSMYSMRWNERTGEVWVYKSSGWEKLD